MTPNTNKELTHPSHTGCAHMTTHTTHTAVGSSTHRKASTRSLARALKQEGQGQRTRVGQALLPRRTLSLPGGGPLASAIKALLPRAWHVEPSPPEAPLSLSLSLSLSLKHGESERRAKKQESHQNQKVVLSYYASPLLRRRSS